MTRLFQAVGRLGRRLIGRARAMLAEPGPLTFSWVTPSIAVGGSFPPGHVGGLMTRGIGAVVDVRAEAADDAQLLAEHGLEWLHLPTPDGAAPSSEQLVRAVQWIRARTEEGKKVLVHCEGGAGRSPLVVCAVLVTQGHTAAAALDLLKARHRQAAPNERQLEALRRFAADHRSMGS